MNTEIAVGARPETVEQFVGRLLGLLGKSIGDNPQNPGGYFPITYRAFADLLKAAMEPERAPRRDPEPPAPFRSRVEETGKPVSMWRPWPTKDQPNGEGGTIVTTAKEEKEALQVGFRYKEDRREDLGPKRPWEPRGW